jgi:hypothetical protein
VEKTETRGMKMKYEEKDDEEQLKIVMKILKSHGIEMNVSACGCCNSPWISMRYNGELVAYYTNELNLEMFDEEGE